MYQSFFIKYPAAPYFHRVLILFCVLSFSCKSDDENPLEGVLEKGEAFGGGAATVFDESENAFGNAAPNLEGDKDITFVVGNAFFRRNWVTAPSSTVDLDGLGPLFNARSCGACHFKDGRGAPPLNSAEEPIALLFRLSRPTNVEWEILPDENYGGQFNHRSIQGVDPEGSVSVSYEEVSGKYPDGTSYSLRNPIYEFQNLNYGPLPADLQVSPRIAPHMIGLGLLEAIPESTLLSLADPDDMDGDGISGKPNYVFDRVAQAMRIGRFGWKANQPTVRQQVAGAFLGDIGLTSSIFPNQPCASNQEDCIESITGGSPELTDQILDQVTLYSQALAVPKRRDWEKPEVLAGKQIFTEIGCNSCHTPKMTTGIFPDLPEFQDQPIRPYSDLLLHDMGEGLADHRPDGLATGTEWKTPPLWGLGLVRTVNDHTFFLHDGRARNFEEAILWHGGEAEESNNSYQVLTKEKREQLIKFLESL